MQRRLLIAMAVAATVFLVTFVFALVVSYPGWMWIFVFAGLIVPPAVGGVALLLLVRQMWTGRAR